MASILDIPEEILTLIFKYYLETETQAAFLANIGNINMWSKICERRIFWKEFDGSLPLHTLKRLSECDILQQTEELKLSKPDRNNRYELSDMEQIFLSMPRLKSIDFSNVVRLEEAVFSFVAKSCPNVTEITFTDNTQKLKYFISWELLGDFLTSRGQNLTILDFSYTFILGCETFLRKLASFCPNLSELYLQEMQNRSVEFPTSAMHLGCPKLKVLCLGSPVVFIKSKKDHQFSDLETFTHPVQNQSHTYFDLFKILGDSFNLKILDLRGCSFQCLAVINALPAIHLECLYLTGQHLFSNYVKELHALLLKWSSSLRVVEMSRMKAEAFSDMLIDAVSQGKMKKLEELNLRTTNISVKAVIEIIENCERLKVLNLRFCRNIGKGKMRKHDGKQNLEKLLDQLKM